MHGVQIRYVLNSQTRVPLLILDTDEEYNGKVVAELLNPRASSDIFKGLQFPSTDIPSPARLLYKLNRVRLLFDREQESCRLICRSSADLESPLDLTHSYLRAMSPVHRKYLKNMEVRSTMSISLDYKDNLWGLICCHSYGPTGKKVPFPVRELTYWLGLCASNNLDKLLCHERIRLRKAASAMQPNSGPNAWLSASSEELLRLFRANFGFLVVRGEARTIGRLSSYFEAITLLKYVYFRNFEDTFASRNITKDFSDLIFPSGFDHIAGILVIPLSPATGDFIIFFRACQIQEVCWAGNPHSKAGERGKLEPRNSFKKWTETVRGTCQPWTEEECLF
jgi:light-regulated signal transduction histidine kinase (bacteriophytochrome)